MEHALYRKLLLDQVIAVALNGTGMIKFAHNVALIGILIMDNVTEFLIIVKLTALKTDYAYPVIKDII